MSSRRPGLAIVEVILVMTISALLFGVVIGTFATRRKAAVDDGARQVMSEIAKVRNQAQQGQATTSPGAGFELFGQGIQITTGASGLTTGTMTVHRLRQESSTSAISSYDTYTIPMPAGLRWWVTHSGTPNDSTYCSVNFTSCYNDKAMGYHLSSMGGSSILVFRNNTGESYLLGFTPGSSRPFTDIANYTASQQGMLRLALGRPGAGTAGQDSMTAAPNQYYAHFNLSIPNNQRLEVVK